MAGDDYEAVEHDASISATATTSRACSMFRSRSTTLAEPDKSLTLTLSDPRGCAVLGAPAERDADDPRRRSTRAGAAAERPRRDVRLAMARQRSLRSAATTRAWRCSRTARSSWSAVASSTSCSRASTPTASLDTSFGTGGKVTTDIAGGFAQERARAVAIQADGKIVVAGEATLPSGDLAWRSCATTPTARSTPDIRHGRQGVRDAGDVGSCVRCRNPAGRPHRHRRRCADREQPARLRRLPGRALTTRTGCRDATFGTQRRRRHGHDGRARISHAISSCSRTARSSSAAIRFGSDPSRRTSRRALQRQR